MRARLLAVKAVRGELAGQDCANGFFRLDVGLRDGRFISLDRDLEVALVVMPDDVGCGARRLEGCRQELGVQHAGFLRGSRDITRPAREPAAPLARAASGQHREFLTSPAALPTVRPTVR